MTKSLDQKKEIKANSVVPHRILRWIILTKILNLELNGIKMRVFFEKNIKKKNTCAFLIRIITTFANQM